MKKRSKHKICIRQFQRQDAKEVSDLIRQTLIEVNSRDYPPEVIQFLCDHYTQHHLIANSSDRLMYVAVNDDRIVGTVSLQEYTILTLFIHPTFQGKGIGTKLMNHIESTARNQGYHVMNVPSSITAYDFYRGRGYRTVKEEHSSNYGRVIIMEKRL